MKRVDHIKILWKNTTFRFLSLGILLALAIYTLGSIRQDEFRVQPGTAFSGIGFDLPAKSGDVITKSPDQEVPGCHRKSHRSPVEFPSSSNEGDGKDQEESFDNVLAADHFSLSIAVNIQPKEISWLHHDYHLLGRNRIALFKLFHCWKSFIA